MKLSDTQLLILSSASQRADHAALLPANLKGSAARRVIDKLLNEKLLQELRAKDDMPIWRRGEDNRPYSLRITKGGLRAIEVADVVKAPDNHAAADPDETAAHDASREPKSSEGPSRAKRSDTKIAAASAKTTEALSDRTKPDNKQGKIVALLQRPDGATLDVLVKETQWQRHSVRGFLAGTVRKKLRLPLLSEKIDGVRTYRIGKAKPAKATKSSKARRA
jgi:Protein of unknown function (DUF3489)